MTHQQPQYPPPGQSAWQNPYAQPGYPDGSYSPQPGQYGQPYPRPPARSGTNGFAVASLVLGILGGVLLSVIFGIIALSQTKSRHQSGREMAIAGLVLSGLWTLGIVAMIIAGVATNDGSVRAIDVNVGDCIETVPGDNTRVSTLPTVPCTTPHSGEVYAHIRVTEDNFPGESALEREYRPRCLSELASYAPQAANSPDFDASILYPTQATWDRGGYRTVVCIVTTNEKRTGSVRQ
jgi:hypothetical protein